jgi:hypothetical protein
MPDNQTPAMSAVPMPALPPQAAGEKYPKLLGWRRVLLIVLLSVGSALTHLESPTPFIVWLARNLNVCLFAVLAFGLLERWPKRLPDWVGRWVLQIVGTVLAGWFGAAFAYGLPAGGDLASVLAHPGYRKGFFSLILPVLVLAPPHDRGHGDRRREMIAREQAMRLQLERSELERQGADTRLRLLQAQVQPHFLFNTLANIRALVNAGSPRAVQVMDSLIAYLRASVPRLQQAEGTVGQELDLVRAYLELMHMRMPDRLQYSVEADAQALGMRCPPMALLTLVENAVRHGVDPSEEGGRIDVTVRVEGGRCIASVADTGVGLKHSGTGGSGLATLRERMKLAFGDAQLRLASGEPRGTRATLEFPAQATGQ